MASASGTTVTFTWAAQGLKVDPEGWTYEMELVLHDGNGDDQAKISGRVATVVFEMTPAS